MIMSQLAARRRNIQVLALGILALAGLALAGAYAWSSWQMRRLQLSNADISTINLTHALADQASSAFKMVDTVLVGLVNRVEHDGLAATDKAALHGLMMDHLAELPALQGLFLYDESGKWIVNSAGQAFNGRDNSDRAYFGFHRGSPDRGVHIGGPIVGRTSGAWVIPVSRRLEHADGRFAGVVLATIKVDFFRGIYEHIELRRDGRIVLALAGGTQLLAIPFARSGIGADLGASHLFARLRATLPAGGLLEAGDQGRTLIYGVRQAGDYPVLVAFARSKDQILEPWRESMLVAGAALIALAAGMGGLGIYLVRQVRLGDRLERDLLNTKAALEASNASLLTQSQVDPLTGLFNKRFFETALERESALAREQGTPLAALMIDVDHFKKYNDSHGHLAGDAALVEVGRAIRAGACRPRDVAARFGGEEFVVLLPATDLDGAAVVAETIRADLAARRIGHRDAPGGIVTISIGASCGGAPHAAATESGLLDRADGALYAAKAGGRNCVRTAAGGGIETAGIPPA